jgi:predicted nucleotidyltransferase component of viral defense system
MLNYDFIAQKSEESQIDSVTIEREYWQLLFLQRLYNTDGSAEIFFKGGTAIRFLLGSFRFSEDLDFTATTAKEKVEALLVATFNFFKKNTPYDLEFKKERVYRKFEEESLKYRFLFRPKDLSQKVSIRVDVSLREKPQTREQTVLTPFDYPISPYPIVMHLRNTELLAEKIRALCIRGKPRDLFDLWFLLTKKIPVDQSMLQKKFAIYPNNQFSFKQLEKVISSIECNELKKDLNQFLPKNYREFYKKLKEETVKQILKY